MISRQGRIEKAVEAHRGAVLSARWSFDGSAVITGRKDLNTVACGCTCDHMVETIIREVHPWVEKFKG